MTTFDVFISYSHKDKTTADAACAALEAAGIRCWIAPRDIVHGMDWGEAIIDAITGAKIMVLIFSGFANVSPQVKREVERAVSRGIPIIPLRLENIPMSKSLEYFLSTSHWLDALTPPLEKHLQHLTKSVEALLKLGGAEIKEAEVTEPEGSARPDAMTSSAFNSRGTAYFNRRDYDRAIKEFDEAIRLDLNYANAFYNRGSAYQSKGDYDRAINDYDEAIRLNPRDAAFFSNRGGAYQVKREFDRAINDYDEAIRLDPKEAAFFSNRATAYRSKGQNDRAIRDYGEAIRLDPKNATFLLNRAAALQDKREFDRAIEDYDEAIRLNPRYANALCSRGVAYHNKGEYERAIMDYDDAIGVNSKDAIALYQRSLAKRAMHDDAGADADLEAAKTIDPNVGL
jgi:tetratricopeptide (TPR) repeat protein